MNRLSSLFTKEKLKAFALINAGVFIQSVGVYFFKFPNNFTTGGVSSLAIILNSIFPAISQATYMSVLNIVLLIVGFFALGTEFGALTAYCSVMFSLETWVFERIYPMTKPFTDEPLLELLFAMMLPAVGSALMFNYGASSGGTDIIAMLLKKYANVDNIGKSLLISDSLIAASSIWFFGMATGLFSLLGLFMKAFVLDSVIESINLCKFFSIVTTKPDEICDYIINELGHSSTVVDDAHGAYSKENRKVVMTACRRGEAIRLRRKVKQVDPHAFMFITNTSEIIGKGFRAE